MAAHTIHCNHQQWAAPARDLEVTMNDLCGCDWCYGEIDENSLDWVDALIEREMPEINAELIKQPTFEG